jgi:phage tail tape-measure protein
VGVAVGAVGITVGTTVGAVGYGVGALVGLLLGSSVGDWLTREALEVDTLARTH